METILRLVLNFFDVALIGLVVIGVFAWLKNETSLVIKLWGYFSFGGLMIGLMMRGEKGDFLIRVGILLICSFLLFVYRRRGEVGI